MEPSRARNAKTTQLGRSKLHCFTGTHFGIPRDPIFIPMACRLYVAAGVTGGPTDVFVRVLGGALATSSRCCCYLDAYVVTLHSEGTCAHARPPDMPAARHIPRNSECARTRCPGTPLDSPNGCCGRVRVNCRTRRVSLGTLTAPS